MRYSLLLLLFISFKSFAQSEVELSIQLLTPDVIAEATLNQDAFILWIKDVNSILEEELKKEEGNFDFALIITAHHDEDVSIDYHMRPQLMPKVVKRISSAVDKLDSPRTLYMDYSMFLVATVNNGGDANGEFDPKPQMPWEKEKIVYDQLSLKDKIETTNQWLNEEVIPLLASFETSVEKQFSGVLAVGNIADDQLYHKSSVDDLTENNFDYWQAVMEMSIGNQIIPLTKAAMHMANGEYDRAERLLFAIRFFMDEGTVPDALVPELTKYVRRIKAAIEVKVNAGIALHDDGKYKEAIEHYKKWLKVAPGSAWLQYELYLSEVSLVEDMNSENMRKIWDTHKPIIYGKDPLYPINAQMSSGKEAYDFMRRTEISSLFKSKEKLTEDIVSLAAIALDLEDYGLAAQLYWMMAPTIPDEYRDGRDFLNYYLYCLDKLGIEEIREVFDLDYDTIFAEIDEKLKEEMKESPFYNSFSGDEEED